MFRAFLLLSLLALVPDARAATVHQVPGDFATIGGALAAASVDDTVRVGAGTFAPSTNGETYPLMIPDGVALLGSGMQSSILDAEQTARVIQLDTPGVARISGFTVRGGVAQRGGGVHVTAGSHEIDGLFITDCGAQVRGSALNVEGAASPSVHHNILWECYDTILGDTGDPHVAQWGGTAAGSFAQNLVGRGDSNGLFVFEDAAPEVRHNIFLDNGIDGVRGRGICFAGNDATTIAYNMFWANSISALVMRDATGTFVNMDAATANDVFTTDGVYGNLDADPMLVDPDALDFALQPNSPAIDAGEPGTGTDPDGTALDLGPIYHQFAVVSNPAAPRNRLARISPPRPNPFNPRTTLQLKLERAGFVEVSIHDARGRRVRTLLAESRDAGEHPLRFDGLDDDGRPLASGVYFARMQALGEVDTTAMVLVR